MASTHGEHDGAHVDINNNILESHHQCWLHWRYIINNIDAHVSLNNNIYFVVTVCGIITGHT
jgi:hypothetical protein